MTSLAVALWAAAVGATPTPEAMGTVSVIGVGACAGGRLEAHVRGLRESLWKRLGTTVQSDEEMLRRLGGTSRSSLADIDRVFSGARYDIDCMAYDRAEQALKLAAADLLALPPSIERWERLRRVYVSLAWAYIKLENTAAAEDTFSRILRVEPGFVLDRKEFPPSTHRLVEKVRTQVKARATATLSIAVRPAGTVVFIEGREIGAAPVTLKVPPGEYRVEAAFGEGRGIPKTVKVEHDERIELDRDFEGAIHPLAGPCIAAGEDRKGRLASLIRLASLVGTRNVVSISHEELEEGERYLVALALDSVTGQVTREAKAKLYPSGPAAGAFDHLADFLATGDATPPIEPVQGAVAKMAVVPNAALSGSAPASSGGAAETAQTAKTGKLRIASYTLGGVAIVALGAGGYFYLGARSAQNDMAALMNGPNVTKGSEGRYKDLSNRRRRDQTFSTVGLATGTAAAVGAVVTFVLSRGSTVPPPVSVGYQAGQATMAVRF